MHYSVLVDVLKELPKLAEGRAMKIPLADVSGSVADIRSAVHRATRKHNFEIATSSDDEFFYLWKVPANGNGE